jgi:hypothetical protein
VTFTGTASNFSSWRIDWLRGSVTETGSGIQNNQNISFRATVNSTAFTGARLTIFSGANGTGTSVTREVSFTVRQS